jgi:hypothetical protein
MLIRYQKKSPRRDFNSILKCIYPHASDQITEEIKIDI